MRKTYYATLFRCWHELLSTLFLSACATFSVVVLLTSIGLLEPLQTLGLATAGIRRIGSPLVLLGGSIGIPGPVMIFLCNLSVAILVASALALALCYDPRRWQRYPTLLRRSFERDRTVNLLRPLPGCRNMGHPRLHVVGFCLYLTPMITVIFFGMLIGLMVASGQFVFGSLPAVMAKLAPHGVFEVPALVLAAAIPFSGYRLALDKLEKGHLPHSFRTLERFRQSLAARMALQVVITLLYVAGIIEAGLSV